MSRTGEVLTIGYERATPSTLLAALRAAVLWRQLGGSYWDFLFSRKAMLETIERQLRGGG